MRNRNSVVILVVYILGSPETDMDYMAALRRDFPVVSTDANDPDEMRTDDRLQSCRRHSPQGRGRVGVAN